jgi:NAD(P)-dependent dehydrogenase (short-subunit alcohol dehydrogenase family)
MTSEHRLKGRLALVTGASRGLGRAVAKALAAEGAHVVLLGRTTGALEDVDDEIRALGGTATILSLDLRAADKLDQLGPTLYQRWGKLDVFVANAGLLGPLSPLPHITADAWTSVIDTNLNANWRLIRTLDPLLRLSDAGRAIFVSSGAAHGANAYWGPYAVSKAGLEALARTYAAEMQNTPVRVNIVNPGAMRTAMRARAFPGEDPRTLPTPEEVAPFVVALALPELTVTGETRSFREQQTKNLVFLEERRNKSD